MLLQESLGAELGGMFDFSLLLSKDEPALQGMSGTVADAQQKFVI